MTSIESPWARADLDALWETDSAHTGGYDAAPREYERRVVRFFSKSLSG